MIYRYKTTFFQPVSLTSIGTDGLKSSSNPAAVQRAERRYRAMSSCAHVGRGRSVCRCTNSVCAVTQRERNKPVNHRKKRRKKKSNSNKDCETTLKTGKTCEKVSSRRCLCLFRKNLSISNKWTEIFFVLFDG